MSIMYDSAVRVQEIADLCINDFWIEKPSMLRLTGCTGKRQKTRIVPLMDNTAVLLTKYINLFHPYYKGTHGIPLFSNRNGEKITRAGISYILNKYVDLAKKTSIFDTRKLYHHTVYVIAKACTCYKQEFH